MVGEPVNEQTQCGVAAEAVLVEAVAVLVAVTLQVLEVVLFLLLLLQVVVVLVLVEVMVVVGLVITFSTRLYLCFRHRGKYSSYLIYSPATLRDRHYYPYFIDVGAYLSTVHSSK